MGIAVDSHGTIFFTELLTVRKIDPVSGAITTLFTSEEVFNPDALTCDAEDSVYFATGNKIEVFAAGSTTPTTLLTSAVAPIYDISIDAKGNVYFVHNSISGVYKTDKTGVAPTKTAAGNSPSDGKLARSLSLENVGGVAVDASGNIAVSDRKFRRIEHIDAASGTTTTIAGGGNEHGENIPARTALVWDPVKLAYSSSGELFYSDFLLGTVNKINSSNLLSTYAGKKHDGFNDSAWGLLPDNGVALEAVLTIPTGLAVDSAGNLFIADGSAYAVRKVDPAGTISNVAGRGISPFGNDDGTALSAALLYPADVTVDSAGNLFILGGGEIVYKVDAAGLITTVAGGGTNAMSGYMPALDVQLNAVALKSGADGNVYLLNGNRILKLHLASGLIFPLTGDLSLAVGDRELFADARDFAITPDGDFIVAGQRSLVRVHFSDDVTSQSTPDTDFDGFPDELEAYLGSNPASSDSTPLGGSSVYPISTTASLAISLNFSTAASDAISFSATLPMESSTVSLKQTTTLDIGGVIVQFAPNDKGQAKNDAGTLKVQLKKAGKNASTAVQLTAKLTKGAFAVKLTDEGLTSTNVTNANRAVPVLILFGSSLYRADVAQLYSCKANKTGKTKTPKPK